MKAVSLTWVMNNVALKRCNIVIRQYCLRAEPDMQ